MKKFILLGTVSSLILFGILATDMVFSQTIPPAREISSQDTETNSTIIVERLPQSSLSFRLLDRVKTSWPWYVSRGSGLVAGFILVMLMLSGAGFITGHSFRFLEPITGWATHRSLGIAFGLMVLIHIIALYFDKFVHFDIQSLLLPFASDYKQVAFFGVSFGSFYVALGIFALYIFIAVILTSILWKDKNPRTWKTFHIATYLGAVFVFFHALLLGTDLANGTLKIIWILAGILVTLAALVRLWRAYTV